MAPKGGKGGGSGGGSRSSSPTCPGAFSDQIAQVDFAQSVVFFVLFCIVAVCYSGVRKKHPAAKKLLGWPFGLSLFFFILTDALEALAAVLYECGTIETNSYLSFYIATTVFWYLAVWLLLFVFVYSLNMMLREQLGNVKALFKMIFIAILGVMFALTAGVIGISCYNLWYQSQDLYFYYRGSALLGPLRQLRIAYIVFYFLSVLAGSGLALMSVFSLRARQHPSGDLISWIGALIFAMLLWVILQLVFFAMAMQEAYLTFATNAALSYIESFAQVLAFICLLCIAKHAGWSKTATTPTEVYTTAPELVHHQQPPVYAHNGATPPPQQQYAYSYPNAQQPAYNRAPVYHGQPGLHAK